MQEHQDKELIKAMQAAGRRVVIRYILKYGVIGFIFALVLAIVAHIVSFFLPLEGVWTLSLAALPIVLVFVIIGWFMRPNINEIAREIDKRGLNEKVITACELSGRDDAYARLQRKDAMVSLKRFDSKKISIRIPGHYHYVVIALVLVIGFLNLIPNPMDGVIEQRKHIHASIDDGLEELLELVDDMVIKDELTEAKKEELNRQLEELAEKLKDVKDYREALKEVSKTEEKLNSVLKDITAEKAGELAELLDSHEITDILAEALANMDYDRIQDAIRELGEQLIDGEQGSEAKQQLREALNDAAENTASNSLRDKLIPIIQSLDSGKDAGQIADELEELVQNQLDSSKASGDIKYSIQQLRNRLSSAIDADEKIAQNNPTGGEGKGPDGQQGEEGQSGQNGGEDNGEGNGEGNEEGNGEVNGNGSGQQGGNNESTGQGSGIGSGSTGIEHIYDPSRLGDGGDISYVPGQNTGQGDIDIEDNMGIGELGGYIPYRQVISEYESEAVSSMNRRALPVSVETFVRAYFTSLEE